MKHHEQAYQSFQVGPEEEFWHAFEHLQMATVIVTGILVLAFFVTCALVGCVIEEYSLLKIFASPMLQLESSFSCT